MIGYNERQEAENLLALLLASREKLAEFNRLGEMVSVNGEAGSEAVTEDVLMRYRALAQWAETARTGRSVALCFNPSDKVQRMPYDMLARCPLTEEETTEAPVDDALLAGLDPQERRSQRRLYHRLLCILPMRTLLGRLCELAAAKDRAAQVKLIRERDFREAIPMTQERKSQQSLDLRGNDFTILDRLMDNRGKMLREDGEFVMPVPLLSGVRRPEPLLAAAIANRFEQSHADGKPQYMAIPGGHVALSVYDGSSSPESFFKTVTNEVDKRRTDVLRLRSYGGARLVQLSDAASDELNRAVFRADAVGRDALDRSDVFCARDDGGRRLYPLLAEELETRRLLADERCMEGFLKGVTLAPVQAVQAVRLLRAEAEAFFRADKMPQDGGGVLRSVKKAGAKLGIRAVRLLVAHAAKAGCLVETCEAGSLPASVRSLLDEMEASAEKRAGFIDDVAGMDGRATLLSMCYSGKSPRMLQAVRVDGADWHPLDDWLFWAAKAVKENWIDDLKEPDFSQEEMAAYCRYGLYRFMHSGRQVGTKDRKVFSLSPGQRGFRTEPDIYFQLFCLWCCLRNGNEPVEIREDVNSADNTTFIMRNGEFTFVDLIAGAKSTDGAQRTEAPVLTTQALKGLLQEIYPWHLNVLRKKKLCISCEAARL